MATVDVNTVTLYYERRGDGPPVLLVPGAAGDAGIWGTAADALADEFTVVTYDRRGNSRSPRPEGWTSTSVEEQATDAAELLLSLGLAPALVYGNSSGAIFVNDLVLRRPEVVRGAVMHEPPYIGVSSNPAQVGAGLQAMVEQGMAMGGPPAAMELFFRFVCGNQVFDALDPQLRSRVLADGEVFFTVELPAQAEYLPGPGELAQVDVPCVVTAGVDSRDPASPVHYHFEASSWLADQLGTSLVEVPGAHVPHLTHPQEFVGAMRPILERMWPTT